MYGYQWMPIHSEGCHLIYFIAPSVIITQFPPPFLQGDLKKFQCWQKVRTCTFWSFIADYCWLYHKLNGSVFCSCCVWSCKKDHYHYVWVYICAGSGNICCSQKGGVLHCILTLRQIHTAFKVFTCLFLLLLSKKGFFKSYLQK